VSRLKAISCPRISNGDLLARIDQVDSSIVGCIKLAEAALQRSDDSDPSTQNRLRYLITLSPTPATCFLQSIESAKTSPKASRSWKLLSGALTLMSWKHPRQSSFVTLMTSSTHSTSYGPLDQFQFGPRPHALSPSPNWRRTLITYYNSGKEKPPYNGRLPSSITSRILMQCPY
jgi:hypothetical protein